LDAFGCDIVLDSPTDRLRLIEKPYRLPFPAATFDFVGSLTVFEHVQNPSEAFREIYRVLRPGGTSIHTFPSRWLLLEPHTHVPLGTVVRTLPWLQFWAALGVRNEFQHTKAPDEVALLNYHYLRENTKYLTRRGIKRAIEPWFPHARFAEAAGIAAAEAAGIAASNRRLGPLVSLARRSSIVPRAYSGLRARVIFLEKPTTV